MFLLSVCNTIYYNKITTIINLENLGRSAKSKFGAKNVYEWKYNFGIILESRNQLFESSGGGLIQH